MTGSRQVAIIEIADETAGAQAGGAAIQLHGQLVGTDHDVPSLLGAGARNNTSNATLGQLNEQNQHRRTDQPSEDKLG